MIPFPAGEFPIVYADPAWAYRDAKTRGAAEKHYRTMSTAELCALPVPALAAPDAVLLMWATWPTMIDALRVGAAWGFEYKTAGFVWVKTTADGKRPAFGMGHYTRANSEPLLLFRRGKGTKRVNASVRQVVFAPRGRHSAKPPEVRDLIVSLFGDVPRVELFARERAPGWASWGDRLDADTSERAS